jgi:hypothetical protein
MVESLDSSFIAPSIRRAMSGGLVIVGVIEIMVHFIAVLVLESVSLFATILDLVVSVSIADDVLKITLTLAALIQSL